MIKLKTLLQEMNIDIKEVAKKNVFKPVTKKKLVYKYSDIGEAVGMSPMTYTVAKKQHRVITNTSDGKETENIAEVGDVIFSGITGETYVIKPTKVVKLYTGKIGEDIYPEQSPREVMRYEGAQFEFVAPWGENMVVKNGDYIVKDPVNDGFYRIAKKEFEGTYNSYD